MAQYHCTGGRGMTRENQIARHWEAWEVNHSHPFFHTRGIFRALEAQQGKYNLGV